MLLQSEMKTRILAGPNLHPGTPGLTLSQSKVLETGSHYDMYRAAGGGSELSLTCLYWQKHER